MTAQFGEVLVYKGERFSLFSNPLEAYFGKTGERPAFDGMSTACWRGYIGSWEFEDDILFFTDINARIGGKPVAVTDLFLGSSGRVRADWVTDRFQVPQGELLQYVHMGYGSTYERDLFLSVWSGRLVLSEVFDNRKEQRLSSDATGQVEAVFGPEEAAFIRAIRANPKERIQRLAYADWLEERNDLRAQLIRLEDGRSPSDPPVAPEEWAARSDTTLRVENWLWMKLLDYPLPCTRWGHEVINKWGLERLGLKE